MVQKARASESDVEINFWIVRRMKNWRIVLFLLLASHLAGLFEYSPFPRIINYFSAGRHHTSQYMAHRFLESCDEFIQAQQKQGRRFSEGLNCDKDIERWKNILRISIINRPDENEYKILVVFLDSFNTIDSKKYIRENLWFCELEHRKSEVSPNDYIKTFNCG